MSIMQCSTLNEIIFNVMVSKESAWAATSSCRPIAVLFLRGEGIQLMNLMLREKKMSR